MSEKIMACLSEDFVRRMRNWARGNAGLLQGMVRAMDYGVVATSGYREAQMPTLTGEASDTERCIAAIPIRYQPAVRQYWSYEGRTLVWHARALSRYGVDRDVFCTWVIRGHECMVVEFARMAARRREALSSSAVRRSGQTYIKSQLTNT